MPVGILQEQVSAKEFEEYRIHSQTDPPLGTKILMGFASVCAAIYNVNRGKKQAPVKIEDCLLKFEAVQGEKSSPATTQSTKEQNAARIMRKMKSWLVGMKLLSGGREK